MSSHTERNDNGLRQALFLSSIFLCSVSQAEINEAEFIRCTKIESVLKRLDCYDNITISQKAITQVTKKTTRKPILNLAEYDKGKWKISVDTDPFDNSKTISVRLASDSGKNQWGKSIELFARCERETVQLFIDWEDTLGKDAEVLTQIGANASITELWPMSKNNQVTYHPNPAEFIRKLLKTDKLLAQITPLGEDEITATFNMKGLSYVIQPIQELCSLDLD